MAPSRSVNVIDLGDSSDENERPTASHAPPKPQLAPFRGHNPHATTGRAANTSNHMESRKRELMNGPLLQPNSSSPSLKSAHQRVSSSQARPAGANRPTTASTTQQKEVPRQTGYPRATNVRNQPAKRDGGGDGTAHYSINPDAADVTSNSHAKDPNQAQGSETYRQPTKPGFGTNRSSSISSRDTAKRKHSLEDGTSTYGSAPKRQRKEPSYIDSSLDFASSATSRREDRRPKPVPHDRRAQASKPGPGTGGSIIDLTGSPGPGLDLEEVVDLTGSPVPGLEKATGGTSRPRSPPETSKPSLALQRRSQVPSEPSPDSREKVTSSIEPAVRSGPKSSTGCFTPTSGAARSSHSSRLGSSSKSSPSKFKRPIVACESSQASRRRSPDQEEDQSRRSTIPESPSPSPDADDVRSRKDGSQGRALTSSFSRDLGSQNGPCRATTQADHTARKFPQPVDTIQPFRSTIGQETESRMHPIRSLATSKPLEHDSEGDITYGSLGSSAPQGQDDSVIDTASGPNPPPDSSTSTKRQGEALSEPTRKALNGRHDTSLPSTIADGFELESRQSNQNQEKLKASLPENTTRKERPVVQEQVPMLLDKGCKSTGTSLRTPSTCHPERIMGFGTSAKDKVLVGAEGSATGPGARVTPDWDHRKASSNEKNGECQRETALPKPKMSVAPPARGKKAKPEAALLNEIGGSFIMTGQSGFQSVPFAMDTLKNAGRVVGNSLEAMRTDNEYWARQWLKDARCAVTPGKFPKQDEQPTPVFSSMRPLALQAVNQKKPSQKMGADTLDHQGKLSVEYFTSTAKTGPSVFSTKCTMVSTDALDVPAYSHYVSIGNNFLAHNEKTLQNWPYFGDDFNMEDAQGLKAQFYVDVDSRLRKLVRLGEAENFAQYADNMLKHAGCKWSDILHFLLDHVPDVGLKRDAKLALGNRDAFCREDFVRGGQRWATLLSSLPPALPEDIGKAAMLCDQFQQMTKFPLWHVVRRSKYVRQLLRKDEEQHSADELTCRVCMRFSCPYHGEIRDGGSQSDNMDDENAVETDIIHPPVANFRTRVGFPPSVDNTVLSTGKDRRNIEYWQKGPYHNLHYRLDERGPFYPCHHPGVSCDEAGDTCSCNTRKVPCEKICGCPPSCPRKFQGCSCAGNSAERKQKGSRLVCFESEKCVCFQLGRECDPDLCGNCGVCDVLDPLHKHKEGILEERCRNANIQRGIPKHTVLGDSGVHGLGLYACEDIREHDFLGEYKGEIIMKEEAERRGAVYEHQKLSYLFSLNEEQEIDSTYFGNKIRFINHADKLHCNLYPRIIMVNTVHRIGLYGSRTIKAGEELFFDYGPMFPNEQLGGKTAKKSAPRVRNSKLVHQFWDVEETEDKHGNLRAVKKAFASTDGDRSSEEPAHARPLSVLAKKSGQNLPKPRGGARSGAGTPLKRQSRIVEEVEGDQAAMDVGHAEDLNANDVDGDHEMMDAGHRLFDYNVVGGEDDMVDIDPQAGAEDDDDFDPDDIASEASQEDTENVCDGAELERGSHRPMGGW